MNFTIYGLFCSQLGSSSRRIEELERVDFNYKRIVEELGKNLQFKLRDFLILPFQRITKYHLILENLFKNTSDLAEKSFLNEAYEAMKDVAVYVNEMKRDQEIIGCINTIERSICDLDMNLLHYGRFMFDGTLKIAITENGTSSKAKQRSVFLFESMILFAKREKKRYSRSSNCSLSEVITVDDNDTPTHLLPSPMASNSIYSKKVPMIVSSALFIAQRSFSRPDTSKYLTLIPGDLIEVLDTIGEDKGWWKGSINGGPSAYFPFSYVKPEQNYLEGEALEGHRVQQLQQQRQQVLLFPQHHQRQHSSNNNGQQQQQLPLNFEEELEERCNNNRCEE
uniref:Uncharacterized protein n=1 Tax=Meloidogyne javanica TaxID=6303 RepID=A0A915MEY1_MELJA